MSSESNEILQLVLGAETSVRLEHSILSAAEADKLPFMSINEYIESGEEALKTLIKIPNLGRKTAQELDHLIRNEYAKRNSPDRNIEKTIFDSIELQDLLPFLHGKLEPHIANRISNMLSPENDFNGIRLCTLAKYIKLKLPIRYMLQNSRLGFKSANALHIFINDVINGKFDDINLDTVEKQKKNKIAEHPTEDKSKELTKNITDLFSQVISPKEYFVLFNRVTEKASLEELSKKLEVSYQRIQQIENNAIKKINKQYGSAIDAFVAKVDNLLDENLGHMSLVDVRTELVLSRDDFILLLHVARKQFKQKIYFDEDFLYRKIERDQATEWNNEIDSVLFSMKWPVRIRRLHRRLEDIPFSYLKKYLIEKRGATIKGQKIIAMEKMPNTALLSFVLRDENRPMTPAEVSRKTKQLFDVDINEHSARAVLSRMEDALIIARGLYALYESIPISQNIIDDIRETSYHYIFEHQQYISSKVLYEELFAKKYRKKEIINDYVVLGILQDDERFNTKPGLMVGLGDFTHEKAVKPLYEEIDDLIVNHGPITVTEIKDRLSKTRRILTVSINLYLVNNERFIRSDKNTYTPVENIFGNTDLYEIFKRAIILILLNEPTGIYALRKKLKSVKCFERLNITQPTLQCVLRRIPNIEKEHEVYNIEQADEAIMTYNVAVDDYLMSEDSVEQIKHKLQALREISDLQDLINVDYRLQSEQVRSTSDLRESPETLDSILNAFGI